MRRSYETIAGLQEACKDYNIYSSFETKITKNLAFKTACEKGYAGIVIYFFDHRKELLNKRLIEEGLEIAKKNGSDEIVSLIWEYTGKIWIWGDLTFRKVLFLFQLLTINKPFDILFLKHVNPLGLLKEDNSMKGLKVFFRFIVMFALASFNLLINIFAIKYGINYLRSLGGFWPSCGCFALFGYSFFQMWLYGYLLYRNLKNSCIKYKIPYC